MLVAIEGIDGSGKATQSGLLGKRARESGLRVAEFSFPAFGSSPFSEAIEWYLNGEFGDINVMPPYLISLLFAGDRFAYRDELKDALATNDLVISDRFVSSNLAHQGAKLVEAQRQRFYDWVLEVEFGCFRMPMPTLQVFIDLPVIEARRRIQSRSRRSYTEHQADYHERDFDYLLRCKTVYDALVVRNDAGPWYVVNCLREGGGVKTPEAISEEIWSSLAAFLT